MSTPVDYAAFLERKAQLDGDFGFAPIDLPDTLFPFQAALVEWALRKGRFGVAVELKASCYRQMIKNVAAAKDAYVAETLPLFAGAYAAAGDD